jgi:hypothetical protein
LRKLFLSGYQAAGLHYVHTYAIPTTVYVNKHESFLDVVYNLGGFYTTVLTTTESFHLQEKSERGGGVLDRNLVAPGFQSFPHSA